MKLVPVIAAAAAAALVAAQGPACTNPVADCAAGTDYFPDKVQITHANSTLRDLAFRNTFVDLTVQGKDAAEVWKYRLVRCGCEAVAEPVSGGRVALSVPPRGVYAGDGPVLGLVTTKLSALDKVRFITDEDFVYASPVRERLASGLIRELGVDEDFATDFSKLKGDDLDVSIIGTFSVSGYVAADTGVPFFVSAEVSEDDPLGRAEWIKAFGILLDSVSSANDAFADIQNQYESVKRKAASVRRRPSVVLNFPGVGLSGDLEWTQPSESQFTTQFLRDANVDYRFMNDGRNQTNVLTVDEVVKQFKSARFLINTGRFPGKTGVTMDEFLTTEIDKENDKIINEAMKKLDAVKCGNVWSNAARVTEDGNANDVFENGVNRPDLVLRDLVTIFHPQLDAGGGLTFSYSYGKPSKNVDACPYVELTAPPSDNQRYVDTEMEITGMSRFEAEDKLESEVIPRLSDDLGIDKEEVEVFFEKAAKDDKKTIMKVRALVAKDDALDISDADTMTTAVSKSLGGDATSVKKLTSSVVGAGEEGSAEEKDGVSGGAVGGIVGGLFALLAVIAGVLYWFGSRRGRRTGEQHIRDRYWDEHRIRLSDDTTRNASGEVADNI